MQTMAIIPKIREVDEFLHVHPEYKNKILESHPELAFARLNGSVLLSRKKYIVGYQERLSILEKYLPDKSLSTLGKKAKEYQCNSDDILDAICLAVTAALSAQGLCETIPENPEKDERGLYMQMTIPKEDVSKQMTITKEDSLPPKGEHAKEERLEEQSEEEHRKEPQGEAKEEQPSEKQKVAVVTGGARGIGKCIAQEFQKQGVKVYVIDKAEGDHYVGDISKKAVLEDFVSKVIRECGGIDYLINNALPLMKGIDECSYEEFTYALAVGVTAPFYLTKLFSPYFRKGASIVNISSSRDRMSQPQTESYTAAKGGIAALTHALCASLAGKVRVNSISPGWIDTSYQEYDGPDALQQPSGRVGNPMDIANMVLFLCSDKAGFINGENICIDGGMTKLMIYHGDHGWTFNP